MWLHKYDMWLHNKKGSLMRVKRNKGTKEKGRKKEMNSFHIIVILGLITIFCGFLVTMR